MKTKELKTLAKKVAEAEYIIQHSEDKDAIKKAQMQQMAILANVHSLEDMTAIDELVMDLLQKNLDK